MRSVTNGTYIGVEQPLHLPPFQAGKIRTAPSGGDVANAFEQAALPALGYRNVVKTSGNAALPTLDRSL